MAREISYVWWLLILNQEVGNARMKKKKKEKHTIRRNEAHETHGRPHVLPLSSFALPSRTQRAVVWEKSIFVSTRT